MPTRAELADQLEALQRQQTEQPPLAGTSPAEEAFVRREELARQLEEQQLGQFLPGEDLTKPFQELHDRPGLFRRKLLEPANALIDAIISGFQEGYAEGYGPGEVEPTFEEPSFSVAPITAANTRLSNLVLEGLEGGLRTFTGVYEGSLTATRDALIELGVSKTNANRTVRDAAAAADVTGIATLTAPPGAVAKTAKETYRAIAQSRKVERYRQEFRAERLKRQQERAENKAAKEAAKAAPPGAEAAARGEAVATIRTIDDLEVSAHAAAAQKYIRNPDELLTDIPVFTQEVLNQPSLQKGIAFARDILRERGIDPQGLGPDRVFKIVMDLLETGDFSYSRMSADMAAAGVSKKDFIQLLGTSASEAGRTLRQFRQFRDDMRKLALQGDQAAADWLSDIADVAQGRARAFSETGEPHGIPILSAEDAAQPFMVRAGRIFRKLLISLPTTAARNFIESGMIRQVLSVADRGIDATMRRVFTPDFPREPVQPFDELGRIFSLVEGGKTREQVNKLFNAYPEQYNRAFAGLEADLAMNVAGEPGAGRLARIEAGADRVLLAMNRAQSRVVRKAVIASSLDRRLKSINSSLEEVIDNGQIPAGFDDALAAAIDEAMYVDFTLPPKGKGSLEGMFRHYAKMLDAASRANLPVAFLEPFPRFVFNATKLMVEHMPTGGLRLISPKSRAKMLEGDFGPFAREFTGSVMFATALAIRQGEFPGVTPGARFDEIQLRDGSNASLAPFATLIPHLFLADLVIRIDEGRLQPSFETLRDFRRGLLGTAPQVARGNAAIDQTFEGLADINTVKDLEGLSEFAGETATGYLRPLQLLRDFRAEWNEGSAIMRETRGRGFMGPVEDVLRGSIPGLDPNALPERQSPTRADPPVRPRLTLFSGEVPKYEYIPYGEAMGPGEKVLPTQVGTEKKDFTIGAGLISQASGLLIRQPRNAIEHEIVELGFTGRDLSPKTGDKRFDALVAEVQGPFLETIGNAIAKSPAYLALPPEVQKEVVRNVITLSRQPAMAAARARAPITATKLKLQRMTSTQREMAMAQIDALLRKRGLTVDEVMSTLQEKAEAELERLENEPRDSEERN